MLGGLAEFLKSADVSQVVKQPKRGDGLSRIVERFEGLLDAFLQGQSLDTVNQHTRNKLLIRSPLEAFANYCVGLLVIGTAAARQLGRDRTANEVIPSRAVPRCVLAVPLDPAGWRNHHRSEVGEPNLSRTYCQ